jgi:sugar phosphate isomerase/epimerase
LVARFGLPVANDQLERRQNLDSCSKAASAFLKEAFGCRRVRHNQQPGFSNRKISLTDLNFPTEETLMKFGICNEIFKGWSLEHTFARAAQAGYDLVEIAPFTVAKSVFDISAAERNRIRDLATKAHIGISGLHWVLVEAEGMYLTHPDSAVRLRTAQYFVELVNCCADLGGNRIIVGSPKQRNLLEGVSYAQAWDLAKETFRDSVKTAEDRGVVICFEPLSPTETDFVNTAEEGIRFAGEFQSPAMSVILDVKAMCSETKPIPQIIRESAGHFEYFHANDRNLRGPGFGDVAYEPIVEALRDAHYGGTVSVEVFLFDEGPERIADESIAYLKRVFGVESVPASV